MRWTGKVRSLLAVALVVATGGFAASCPDNDVRTYIGHENQDGTRTGLVAWLDTVAIAVCGLEKVAVGLPNGTRLCPQADNGSDGPPNPPPPPPWGGD